MTFEDLLRYDPWWKNPKAIQDDPHVMRFNTQKIKYEPLFTLERGTYVVRGPRQVGKTTLVKLKISQLLEQSVPPENVFYYSFELVQKPEQIRDTISEYLETIPKPGKRHIFLDEITTVPDWALALKQLIDRGDLTPEDAVMATGSSSIDLKKGAERLPGRGIEGHEFYYLPCSFRSYLTFQGIHLPKANPMDTTGFMELAQKNKMHLLELNKAFTRYLQTGGFLYAINHGADELTLEKYARWLEGDFLKWGKNPLIVKEILQAVIRKASSQFSYHALAKETSVTSHNTINDYLKMLGEELFLKTINKVTLTPYSVQRKKEKKAYFLDPLLCTIAERWAQQTLPEACKIEQAIQSHLSRLGPLHFYNDGKKEIDAVVRTTGKTLAVEVKWSDNIGAQDTYAVRKADAGYVVSRQTLSQISTVPVVPVSLFLALLDTPDIIRRNVLTLE